MIEIAASAHSAALRAGSVGLLAMTFLKRHPDLNGTRQWIAGLNMVWWVFFLVGLLQMVGYYTCLWKILS